MVSRKVKNNILNARKIKRDVKYKGNDIYVNEHLSPKNRELFALASQKRKDARYKYLWTKNGVTHMRKTDSSEIYLIKNKEQLSIL